MADGSRHSMFMVQETTYGVTPVEPELTPIRITGTTLGLTKDPLQSEEIRDDRQIADFRHGARQVGGNITTELSFGSFDEILQGLLGGTWDNDVLTAGIIRRSYTILRHFADLPSDAYHILTGVEFNSLSLQVNANAIITGEYSVVGKDLVIQSSPILDSEILPRTTTSPLDSFTGVLKDGGNEIAVVTEIQLNVDNGLDPRFVVGSKTTIRPSIGRSNVSGQVTAYFESGALLKKFVDEIESSLEFNLPDGEGNNMKFLIPRLKYNGGQPDVQGDGPITLSIPFQGLLDPVIGTNIQITREPA